MRLHENKNTIEYLMLLNIKLVAFIEKGTANCRTNERIEAEIRGATIDLFYCCTAMSHLFLLNIEF